MGMPAKRRLIPAPGRFRENDGVRESRPSVFRVILSVRLWMSCSRPSSSRDLSLSSRDATISNGRVTFSR
ncbi:hypothetical protein D9M68_959640 [compost metagenome]